MVTVTHRNVKWARKRLGDGTLKTFYYHRLTGLRLPDDPAGPAFAAALADLNTPARAPAADSFDALATRYLKSPAFDSLAERTRAKYRATLDDLRAAFGPESVARIARPHVLVLQDKLASARGPHVANYTIAVLRRVLGYGLDVGLIQVNPALRPGRLRGKGKGHRPWPRTAIRVFMRSAPAELRRALIVGLYTGQREGDCLRMTWRDWDGQGVRVRQAKTSRELWVPAHRALRLAIGHAPKRAVTILTTATGRPWRPDHFRHSWRRAILAAGLDGYTFHGLRKTAATRLAEVGCSVHEIQAITGHATLAMVALYTRGADQRRLAEAAIVRLERNRTGTKIDNRPDNQRNRRGSDGR